MKKKKEEQNTNWPADLLFHMLAAGGLLVFCSTLYFYVLLPYITRHGETVSVPYLEGVQLKDLNNFLSDYQLRYEVSDSSYTKETPPLTVLQQFPKAGSKVKKNRRIYVTVNQVTPPTIALPNIIDQSKINADAVLRSNSLQIGRVISVPSPFSNLIKEARYLGEPIKAGTLIPKGAVIDLVVGDGKGQSIFEMTSLMGASYEQALSQLKEWNLHVGSVKIPTGIDTTKGFPVVYMQYPDVGELVHIGDIVDIWLAPAGYEHNDVNQ